jgi:diguanylate cyclase (GGDEF)-like protein
MTSHRSKIFFSFCVAIVVLRAVTVSVYTNFTKMNNQKRWVEHTYTVIGDLQKLMSNMKDIQSSQRGYVITGMEDYLTPYYIALPKVEEGVESVAILMKDNPEQLESLKKLKIHIDKRLASADQVITTYKNEGQRAAIDLIRQGLGKREMDEIRVIVADMIAHEQNLLSARRTSVRDYSKITMYAGVSGLFVFIVILSAVFMTMIKESDQRVKTENNLLDAVSQMERNSNDTKLISKMGDYLRGCREQEEAYEMIASNMPALFPNSFGSISIFNSSRNILRSVLTWGELPEGVALEFEPEDCWGLRQGIAHLALGDGAVPICQHLEHVKKDFASLCLPMQAQGETMGQIYIGCPVAMTKVMGKQEMGTMRRVTEQISLALANLNLQRALKEQSIKDPLTKLYNRRYLEETLEREISRAQRNHQSLTLLLMDIDHFKKVNDTYGHDAGDAVLVAFAKLLVTKSRKEDVACRWGGEEFILLLSNANAELARARAQEVCDAARNLKFIFQGKTIPITVSIGAAVSPEHGEITQDLIHNADLSLYKAKQSGRDRVVVFEPAHTSLK